MHDDLIFKALSDPSRRTLLDLLFVQDGQTLSDLQAHLPMTRFGTMKHLSLLEEAGLITTRKIGREKYHYLNPVPIQGVYDRWVSKYAQPWTQTLSALKQHLEEPPITERPSCIYQTYIRTTPAALWNALTDPAATHHYYYGGTVESTWDVGAPITYKLPNGMALVEGEIVEYDPPRRLRHTFHPLFQQELASLEPGMYTFDITPMGEVCQLTLTHDGVPEKPQLAMGLDIGVNRILAGLKTLLETGEPLGLDMQPPPPMR